MKQAPAKLGTVYTAGAKITHVVDGTYVTIVQCCDTPNQIETIIDQIRRSGRKGKAVELWVLHSFGHREYIGKRAAEVGRVNPVLATASLPKW